MDYNNYYMVCNTCLIKYLLSLMQHLGFFNVWFNLIFSFFLEINFILEWWLRLYLWPLQFNLLLDDAIWTCLVQLGLLQIKVWKNYSNEFFRIIFIYCWGRISLEFRCIEKLVKNKLWEWYIYSGFSEWVPL